MSDTLIGIGSYTATEAARLLRLDGARERLPDLSAATIYRWLAGYSYSYKGERRFSEPLWDPQIPTVDNQDHLEIGFRDLVELRFVRSFLALGLGLPTIRTCLDRAREIVGDTRPFSTDRFRTDGKTIFLRITEDLDEPQLIDLKHRQYAFNTLVSPSFRDLDFEEVVIRWWPLNKRMVVLDPARSFGQPIVAETGVSGCRRNRRFGRARSAHVRCVRSSRSRSVRIPKGAFLL